MELPAHPFFRHRLAAVVAAGLLLLPLAPVAAAEEPCACRTSGKSGTWCDVHGVGRVGGLAIHSKFLFEAVDAHGHEVDAQSFACPVCRLALASDGYCAEHRIGFFDGKAYFSRLTHLLALGDAQPCETLECPVCREHASGHGWCDACGVGMAGSVAISDRQEFAEVERALEILRRADEAARRCEHCAVAMLTDTTCPVCKIAYADGEAVPPVAARGN